MPTDAATKTRYYTAIAAQVIAALIGVYLMAAPAIWGYGAPAEKVERFIGPLIASFATMAAWEVLRGLRRVNVVLAAALIVLAISPWPWAFPMRAILSDVVAAAAVIGLSVVPYPQVTRFGGGWRAVWRGSA